MGKIPLRLAFKFYWEAQTIYSAHSPFIYQFMKEVMDTKEDGNDTILIEKQRQKHLQSVDDISFIDYGAGTSKGSKNEVRKISSIAQNSLSGKWQCKVLFNLIKHFGISNVLEIGTSLGISTAYLAIANQSARIITLEGNPASAAIAKKVWDNLDISSVEVLIGEFGETMDSAIESMEEIDLAFIDGNHRKEATLKYFQKLKNKATIKSVFVIDDIYWSTGMNDAWNEIIKDESVAFSIDLFRMGIIFFDQTIMPKQHFKLITYKLKPWSIGLFG
jgi:predicted O-methyltransferase YrrM